MALKTQYSGEKTNKQTKTTTKQVQNSIIIKTFPHLKKLCQWEIGPNPLKGFIMKEILQEIFPVGIIPHSQLILRC